MIEDKLALVEALLAEIKTELKKKEADKLYLLRQVNPVGYDEYVGFVVRASSEEEARSLCKRADEGDIWSDPKLTTCEEIPLVGEAEIILESFNAG